MQYITVYANTYVYDTSLHVEILTQRLLGAAHAAHLLHLADKAISAHTIAAM